jgi:hypothetical protein
MPRQASSEHVTLEFLGCALWRGGIDRVLAHRPHAVTATGPVGQGLVVCWLRWMPQLREGGGLCLNTTF